MPPNQFESEVESFLERSHADRAHNKQQADHHTVTSLCGTLIPVLNRVARHVLHCQRFAVEENMHFAHVEHTVVLVLHTPGCVCELFVARTAG